MEVIDQINMYSVLRCPCKKKKHKIRLPSKNVYMEITLEKKITVVP